jgi:hypothetical protein
MIKSYCFISKTICELFFVVTFGAGGGDYFDPLYFIVVVIISFLTGE